MVVAGIAFGSWTLTAGHSPSRQAAPVERVATRTRTKRPIAHSARLAMPAAVVLGLPNVKVGPVPGYVLVADRNNNRLLILSPAKKIVWRFPRPGDVRAGQSFHDPDDAFF